MAMIRVNTDPTRRQLNQFGFVWLGFLLLFAGMAWWRFGSPEAARWLAVAAVAVPVVGWVWPAFMKAVYVGLSYAAFPIGFVVSHVVMALVYYLVVTPIGLVMRVLGHDPMHRGFDRQAGSYWVERTQARDPRRYYRQF
jgi:fatty acid desaturase